MIVFIFRKTDINELLKLERISSQDLSEKETRN